MFEKIGTMPNATLNHYRITQKHGSSYRFIFLFVNYMLVVGSLARMMGIPNIIFCVYAGNKHRHIIIWFIGYKTVLYDWPKSKILQSTTSFPGEWALMGILAKPASPWEH